MNTRLGIIGAGQLGLYLCEAAHKLGMKVAVLSDTEDAPALAAADSTFIGAIDNPDLLNQFLADCDVITFDKEGIPGDTLTRLVAAENQGRISVNPSADTLLMLKDKGLQKTWLSQQNLPTLPFQILPGGQNSPGDLAGALGDTLVQKARCGGYDGRGVQMLGPQDPASKLWDLPSIVEPFLGDCCEISVITARSRAGDMQTYTPVSMEFDPQLNSVKTVSTPAAIEEQLRLSAVALAEQTVKLLDGCGVFAIEMFVTPAGELLINEISPRVHNSGHLTLDACNVSQFEQHVRAVTGLPLVEITEELPAAMFNILYVEPMRENCPESPGTDQLEDGGTAVYWYGKAPGKAGRKMGHINTVAPSVAIAREMGGRALADLQSNNQEHAA